MPSPAAPIKYGQHPRQARKAVARYQPLFWLEAVAIVAFGLAWLVKGQAILKDRGTPPVPPGPPATSALLARPGAVAVDPAGDILAADTGSDRIRQITG